MEPNVSALERAFALARSGKCVNVGDIKKRLRIEGYSDEQIVGQELHTQLAALISRGRQNSDRQGED
jgi:hypothetical protein